MTGRHLGTSAAVMALTVLAPLTSTTVRTPARRAARAAAVAVAVS